MKFTVTATMTSYGIGVYRHCLMAAIARACRVSSAYGVVKLHIDPAAVLFAIVFETTYQ